MEGEGVALRGASESGRLELSIAVMRAAVVGVTAVVYVASLGVRRPASAYAVAVLAVAAVYSLWVLLARPVERTRAFAAGTVALDTGIVTFWCHATGAARSEFWALYVLVVIAAAMRFGLGEVLGVALAQSAVYVAVMVANGGIGLAPLVFRVSVVLLAGLSVGALARLRRVAERGRQDLAREAKAASRELARERSTVERLQEMDAAKSEFVAIAAHELRSPLAAIRGVVETIRRVGDDVEPEGKGELLDGAAEQAARLSRLLDDLLTVSRIEAGSVPLRITESVVEDLVSEAAQASDAASLVSVSIKDVHTVPCDADRLVRVLANLLDNARKHSPKGAVIGVDVQGEGDFVRFGVRDRGVGVPQSERDAIFERYRRIEERAVLGTGLGLFIARSLVEAHGGRIGVEDAPGGGADFYFLIPSTSARSGRRAPEGVAAKA